MPPRSAKPHRSSSTQKSPVLYPDANRSSTPQLFDLNGGGDQCGFELDCWVEEVALSAWRRKTPAAELAIGAGGALVFAMPRTASRIALTRKRGLQSANHSEAGDGE